jgi:hypothetical protein
LAVVFGKFIGRPFQETTKELPSLHGRRERANPRMLRESRRLEELELQVEDLPLLAKSIRFGNDRFAISVERLYRHIHCQLD